MQIAFPYRYDPRGFVAGADTEEAHLRDLIEQVLFTNPGERVNRPDFGCGLRLLVFETPSSEIRTAAQALIQSQLQRWLGDLLQIDQVRIHVEESRFDIDVHYTPRGAGAGTVARFGG